MENGLCIYQTAFREVEVNASSQEFLCQQGNIVVVGVESRKVATRKLIGQCLSELFKGGFVLHIRIRDTRQLLHFLRDRLLGVHQFVTPFFLTVGEHLNIGYLDDAILDEIKTRRLQIEDDEWLLQIQFHRLIINQHGHHQHQHILLIWLF